MSTGKRVYNIFRLLSAPLRREYVFFTFMYIVFIAARIIESPSSREPRWIFWIENAADLYIICALLMAVPRKARRWVRLLFYIIGYVVAFSECFIHERFHLLFGPITIQLLSETNSGETGEFLAAYLKGPALLKCGLTFLGIILLNIATEIIRCRTGLFRRIGSGLFPPVARRMMNIAAPLFVAVCMVLTAGQKVKMGRFFMSRNTDEAEHCEFSIFHTPLYRVVFSMKFLQLSREELVTVRRNVSRIRIDSCAHTIPTIVLYIGESYNKHHSSLYGYQLPTTPLQEMMQSKGNLVAFTDVVTPWNVTSNVFKDILSTHSTDAPGSWIDGTLLPGVLKKAGYKVAFITSQYYKSHNLGTVDFNGSFFLNDPAIEKLCFDYRNKYRKTYDLSLLKEVDKVPAGPYRFIIFHGMGQHQEYRKRFTDADVVFTAGSYPWRRDLSLSEKQIVADYDNATRYNDRVVEGLCRRFRGEDAVVVYLPDHGEEVYDRIHSYGRDHDAAISADLAYGEFEVPFEIWFSPRARRLHPDIYRRAVENSRKPFASDDLPHVIMGLAGIHTPLYSPSRDILSPSFQPGRRRPLKGTTDYDSLMTAAGKRKRA